MVNKKLMDSVNDFIPVHEQMCCLRLRGRFFNMTLICTQTPTEKKDEDGKKSFCY
jgi:hypothetical protein